jgi:hypothetical protein
MIQKLLLAFTSIIVLFTANAQKKQLPFLADMVHNNPGEPPFSSSWFNNAANLESWGYTTQIPRIFINCAVTYDKTFPGTFTKKSKERAWVDSVANRYQSMIAEAKKNKIEILPFTDFLVLPEAIVKKYYKEIVSDSGLANAPYADITQGKIKPDLSKPMTQKLLRAMIDEIFTRFPDLDGLTVRTGEIYLQDCPYHTGGNIIQGKIENHILLANLLREEVCVKRHKKIIYRTWDFGLVHTNAENYLKLESAVAPDPNFIFSIKHQKGDFHRFFVFNPTLGTGKHKQIVEICCQLDCYGKAAHPYYIGQGLIDGWEEYKFMQPNAQYNGLKDLLKSPNFYGIWTWSRGGGWKGPYIKNELWSSLNTYVLSKWSQNTGRSEEEIFNEFATQQLKLTGKNVDLFRQIALLSEKGTVRGELTFYRPQLNVWWDRDEFLGGLDELKNDFNAIIDAGLADKVLKEKEEAVAIWKNIEGLSREIQTPDMALTHFIQVSSTYGRIKFEVIMHGWSIMMLGLAGDRTEQYDSAAIKKHIAAYDKAWAEWNELYAKNADCPTLYRDTYFLGDKPGMGASVNKYRKLTETYTRL